MAGSRVPTPGTPSRPPPPPRWPLASEDGAVFTLGRLFIAREIFFEIEIRFFMKPFRCP